MYTLYYSPGTCAFAAHIMLEECGQPYQLQRVDLPGGAQRQEAYRALNPKGRVPLFVLPGGALLTEVSAILLYLARRHPEHKLLPEALEDEARVYEWLNWLATVHAATVATIWRPLRFLEDTTTHAALAQRGHQTLHESYALINERLRGKAFAAGARYSVADIYLLVFYRWGYRMALPMKERYPAWASMMEAIATRPAVQDALSQEGIQLNA